MWHKEFYCFDTISNNERVSKFVNTSYSCKTLFTSLIITEGLNNDKITKNTKETWIPKYFSIFALNLLRKSLLIHCTKYFDI